MAKRRGNGEGCIYERKKGQWAAVVSDGTDKNGKTKRKFLYGKSREEVREKLRLVQNQQAAGGIVDAGRLNLATWLLTWCNAYAKPNIKQTTYENYLRQIRCHISPELGGILLKKLTTTDIQCFYAKLAESGNKSKIQDPETGEMVERGGGLSPASILRIHNILNAALEQAKSENKIIVNPVAAAKPPRVEKKEMRVLTQNQVGIFLDK
ncbi:MAG: N-terminal phage integrase SAM-like domain-containing protein, partial [Christensenellales bacterium]